ncbi:hypothetical protein M9Y10_030955 [Tritrichomonas musculus]|uniref:Tubby C-terminal domain-containing protein n=1 Tax=Tritrichomonas musculus TaxID=1915356 RepID=A0ABR2H2F8_9EUKA
MQTTMPYCSIQNEASTNILNDFEKDNNKVKENDQSHKSIIYQIKISYHFMKCPFYTFSKDGNILYTAKHLYNEIFIGKGNEVHISKDTSNRIGQILQEHRLNSILADGKRFKLKYVESGKPNHFSLSVNFPNKGKEVTWRPKKYDLKKNPKKSKRDCSLENSKGQTVLSLKKKSNHLFEIDTLQSIDPLMIFVIGISGIIGPHDEPFGGF